jgi:L-rhamnose mutarotase
MTRRHCLTLDLKDDPALIAAYRRHHEAVWPGVLESLRASGIVQAELYLRGTRLVMILDVSPEFSFEAKAGRDLADPIVQDWERLMWTFQQALPDAPAGEKWQPMERIFAADFGGRGRD